MLTTSVSSSRDHVAGVKAENDGLVRQESDAARHRRYVKEAPDVRGGYPIAGFHADEPAPFGSGTARRLRSP
jgi:hypothetical protein